jgi:hypothetical protein
LLDLMKIGWSKPERDLKTRGYYLTIIYTVSYEC